MIAGDESDLAVIQLMLSALPDRSHGMVFVEYDAERTEPAPIHCPPRVSIHWLPMQPGPDGHGRALARAIDLWREEFLTAPDFDDPSEFRVWIGCAACPVVAALNREIEAQIQPL
ncbi:MAG: SIP domain-containing protein [Pseudoclavibacter caeni]|jgi:NADPH-dependent ferric siderophore reductase